MDQDQYYRTHPPRCLAELAATASALPKVRFNGHGEPHNPVFSLACRCGATGFRVHGFREVGADSAAVVLSGPYALECVDCGRTTPLFDPSAHGHDAELGHGALPAGGEPVIDDCGCGQSAIQVFARFEYPTDLLERPHPDFVGRAQDLFTWFTLVGRCTACLRLLSLADLECA